MEERHHITYCERCGVALLPADPEPLCAMCYVSDSNISAPTLLLMTDASWSGATPSRPATAMRSRNAFVAWRPDPDGTDAKKRRIRSRRLTLVFALITLAAVLFAVVPAAISANKPGPVHIGIQEVDASTNACIANLYTLVNDKIAGRASPADIVCPVTGKPYIYTQYQGVTTISCPDAAAHQLKRIYVRTDAPVPIVN